MNKVIIIQGNSFIQIAMAISAAKLRYNTEDCETYLKVGAVNNHIPNTGAFENFKDFDNDFSLNKYNSKSTKFVIISASNFPIDILRKIPISKISKLIKTEEGMGSYGNLRTKVTELCLAGYTKLAAKHVVGIVLSSFLLKLLLQEEIFLFDKKNNVNVVFLKKLSQVVRGCGLNANYVFEHDGILLGIDELEAKFKRDGKILIKPHPAWSGDIYDELKNIPAEILLMYYPFKFIISKYSSTSLYAPFLSGANSVCISSRAYSYRLSRRQKALFSKYCTILSW